MLQAAKYIGSGLATIGLTKHILDPVLSPRLLCPSVISPTAVTAIRVVDGMLRSLPEDSPVLQHLQSVSGEAALEVIGTADGGLAIPFSVIHFPDGNIPEGVVPATAGVYAFTEEVVANGQDKVRQAFGSAIDFQRRLGDHKDQFDNRARPTSLHNIGNPLGGINAFNWGMIYTLPNYLYTFYISNPGYNLSQGEYDILMAVTQLVPRILEQSLFEHFDSHLTGQDRLVRFRYTSFDSASLDQPLDAGSTSIAITVVKEDGTTITYPSIEQAVKGLGMARNSVSRYINHELPLMTPTLGPVFIRHSTFTGTPLTHTLIHRNDKEKLLPPLVIPGLNFLDLPMGQVYAYNPDMTPYNDTGFSSILTASKELNPSSTKARGTEIKISRLLNKHGLVDTELGSFYFIRNPDSPSSFLLNQQGIYACDLYDLELGTCVPFSGLKPIVAHLSWFEVPPQGRQKRTQKVTYDRVKTCYDNSSTFSNARVLFNRFKIVPKSSS